MKNKKPERYFEVDKLPRGFVWDSNTPPESVTPHVFVGAYAYIPDFVVMVDYQVQKADEAFEGIPGALDFLKLHRKRHLVTHKWLHYYMTGDDRDLSELTFDPFYVSHKPIAELIMARYRLILEVYPRSGDAQEKGLYPLRWLFYIELNDFRKSLNNLLDGNVKGKTSAYHYMKDRCDNLKLTNTLKISRKENMGYLDLLESQAVLLCKDDPEFHPYWQKYLNDIKRFYAKMQAHKHWQMVTLENGYLSIPSGRTKKKRNR
jgi:hypothetical protein